MSPLDGDDIFEVHPLQHTLDAALLRERVMRLGALYFAGLTTLLVFVGLYAVLNLGVMRRIPEIGLRIALGAPTHDIRMMVIREALVTAAAGLVAGSPVRVRVRSPDRQFPHAGGIPLSAILELLHKKSLFTRPVGQVVKTPPFHGGNRGSSPLRVTTFFVPWRLSSAGRASALQAEGRRFDPVSLHHFTFSEEIWMA